MLKQQWRIKEKEHGNDVGIAVSVTLDSWECRNGLKIQSTRYIGDL